MSGFIIAGIILGGLIWLIGSIGMLSDLLKNGKSLDDYREQYGHDLGMLVCFVYRGLIIFAWPVMGFFGFTTGLVRDVFKLFKH